MTRLLTASLFAAISLEAFRPRGLWGDDPDYQRVKRRVEAEERARKPKVDLKAVRKAAILDPSKAPPVKPPYVGKQPQTKPRKAFRP